MEVANKQMKKLAIAGEISRRLMNRSNVKLSDHACIERDVRSFIVNTWCMVGDIERWSMVIPTNWFHGLLAAVKLPHKTKEISVTVVGTEFGTNVIGVNIYRDMESDDGKRLQ